MADAIHHVHSRPKWISSWPAAPAMRWYRTNVLARLAGRKIRRSMQQNKGKIEELTTLALAFRYHFILPRPAIWMSMMQVPGEMLTFAKTVAELRPSRVLEIGTAGGGTLLLWCGLSDERATLISLDLPGGPYGFGYAEDRERFYRYFAYPSQKLHLIKGDSHEATMARRVEALLDEQLDFLFIDGDHSYNGVKSDHQMYSHLVRKGGIIAFHDIAEHDPARDVHVQEFWKELKSRMETHEAIEDENQGWGGIGWYVKE